MNNGRMTAKRLAELSLLTAAALIIFIIELYIPDLSPVPGAKLGLANIITVYCVYRYKAWETALVVTVRVMLGALLSANFAAILYSAAGAMLCLAGMTVIARLLPKFPVWVCSMVGAVLHNVGQLAAAALIMRSVAVFGYLPLLLLFGCAAGLFTGLCAQFVMSRFDNKV